MKKTTIKPLETIFSQSSDHFVPKIRFVPPVQKCTEEILDELQEISSHIDVYDTDPTSLTPKAVRRMFDTVRETLFNLIINKNEKENEYEYNQEDLDFIRSMIRANPKSFLREV